MIRNYILISLRSFKKHKLYSVINILSLALGISVCLMIFLFIQEEVSFDSFHKKADVLYRLDEVQSFPGTNTQKVALSMPAMGPNMFNDFPEIVDYTRFWSRGKRLFSKDEISISIEKSAYVDSTFLNMFDFVLLEGDRVTALSKPNSIILTKETAGKFFEEGDEILNRQITADDRLFTITGILENVPENSHLQFDALMSISTITSENPEFNNRWGSNFLVTYFELASGTDLEAMSSRYPEFLSKYMPDDERNVNEFYKLFLQPLSEVHLTSNDIEHDYNNYRKFNGQYIDVFEIVGFFILLIAAINFMNLTTSRSSYRWKEVGIRKSIGAIRSQLFSQFVMESFLLSLVSFFLSIVIGLIFTPLLGQVIARPISFSYYFLHPQLLLLIFIISSILGLLAGLYPSLYLSSFKAISAIKRTSSTNRKSPFQNSMVILQFGLAIAMIISTLVVIQQLMFIKNKDVGFNKDQILLVDMNQTANDQFENLKTELTKSSNILGVTASGQRLGNNFHQWGFRLRTDTAVIDVTPSNVNVDFNYLDVYDIHLQDGRGFDKNIASDNGMAFIINKSFADELGLKNPVGTPAGHGWYNQDSLGSIIGVVADFNFNSLHYKINTLAMVVHPEWGYDELSVKLNADNIPQAIKDVEKVWNELVPDWPFQYTFLSSHFESLYRSEEQMSKVVSIIAALAILIACMGLFGLSAIAMEKKTKEIGIRKVMGASIQQLMFQLSTNFTLLVLISFVLFSPVAVIMLKKWLENFAYRINLEPWVFIAGGLTALMIALVTVSYHILKSALANPVDTLRYE